MPATRDKLRAVDESDPRIPLVIVACGSFSPITFLHLRMFGGQLISIHPPLTTRQEMAHDYVQATNKFQILGGYFSPVSDAYNKHGLAKGEHRVAMCELALHDSQWLMVDDWETKQREFQRTAVVLDHFYESLNAGRCLI